jgi:invasion protein IalB
MRILLSLFLALVVISIAAGVALFTGAISIAQPESPSPAVNLGAASTPPGSVPVASAAPQGQPKVINTATYGDWIYGCVEQPETKEVRCSISQRLSDAESKADVFLWRIMQDGKGGLVGVWQTPNGVLLSRGIVLEAGTPKPIAIPYETCGNGGCQAVANLAADFVETLAKTPQATATVFKRNGEGVKLALSVKGLAEGLTALRQ